MLAKIASPAPRATAYARARTFSAYEVDLTPVSAPRSLRTQGAVTTEPVGGAGAAIGAAATITFTGPCAAWEPSGPRPAV